MSVPEVSAAVWTHVPTKYMPDINAVTVDMSYTYTSDSGVPPLPSRQRQRSPPHPNPHQSHPPTTPPIPLPQRSSHTPHQGVPGTLRSALTDPSTRSSAPPVTQRGSIVGRQHTLSNAHPRLHAVHSPPVAFPRHVGSPIQEQNMYSAYISPSMMLPPYAPVYQYRTQPDLVPTPSHTFPSASAPTSPIYPHAFTNTSPSPHSRSTLRHVVSDSLHGAHYSTPYAMHGTHTPMGFTTHPPYAYSPLASFVPASSMYGSHCPLPHYYHPYGFPTGQEGQGTWWHSPPGTTVAFEGTQREYQPRSAAGSSPVGQLDGEPPDQQNPLPSEPQPTLTQTRIVRSSDDVEQEATHVSSPTSLRSSRTKHQERRSYHPNPPSYRSEWVMWAGNVPSDVTQDEIREFFNQPLPPLSPAHSEAQKDRQQVYGGVSTVFLISRSYCAFVNFESEAQLEAATARFNGQPIRPYDPWCLPLVCRVRRREDDLMAGVGGQRGSGMHIKWVKEHKAKVQRIQAAADTIGSQKDMMRSSSPLSVSSEDSRGRGEGRSTNANLSRSASIASTSSDILTRYFPKRYFVLKSLTHVCLPPLLNPQHSKTHTLAVRSGPERSKEYVGNSTSQ